MSFRDSKLTILKDFISKPILAIMVAAFVIVLVSPMLFNNIKSDPRLVPYFSLDEGYGRDLAWYYYSGEKLETFQYSLDYGVENHLIVDLIARPLGVFIQLTPNLLLLIIRLFHSVCGIASLCFLWKFTKIHFPSFWLPTALVISFAISPVFVLWLDQVKPEPFLVLLIILSLDYTLRILEDPSWKNLIFAVIFSSAAFMVKLIGIFLLPGIFLSLYFSYLIKNDLLNAPQLLKAFKQFGKIISIVLVVTLLVLSFIVKVGSRIYLARKSGFLDLERFQDSFHPTSSMLLFIVLAMSMLIIGYIIMLLWLRNRRVPSFIFKKVNVLPIFILSSAITGYRWTFNLFEWAITYARWLHQQQTAPLNLFSKTNGSQSLSFLLLNMKGWFLTLIKSDSVGIISMLLLILYFIAELIFKPWRDFSEQIRYIKRLFLICFCGFFLSFLVLFQSRYAAHHVIIFNVIFLLLGFEGLRVFLIKFKNNKMALTFIILFYLFCFLIILSERGYISAKWRIDKLKQKYDIVYTIDSWWKNTYPFDTKIVADAPYYVYIPSEFKNVVFVQPRLFLDLNFKTNPENLKNIILKENPKLIFYNEGTRGGDISPELTELLKNFRNIKLRKIKEFTGNHFEYYCFTGDRFVLYEVTK